MKDNFGMTPEQFCDWLARHSSDDEPTVIGADFGSAPAEYAITWLPADEARLDAAIARMDWPSPFASLADGIEDGYWTDEVERQFQHEVKGG